MHQLYSNLKKGEIRLKAENLDDLWYLSSIIGPKDLVRGKTLRKIRIGEKDQRKTNVIKKPVFIEIEVEKIEFSRHSNILRVSGVVREGPEDIPKGTHHTFNIGENSIITVTKEKWLKYHLGRLNEALEREPARILLCILDREEAIFALTKKQGYEILSHIKGNVRKKADASIKEENFYQSIIKALEEYIKRYGLEKIIVASPAFWKEELLKNIKDAEMKKMITLATCSSVDKTAINEVLKRSEVREVLKQDRAAKEANLVESLLVEIAKNNLAVYGLKETENASNMGAVKLLLITDSLIRKSMEENAYQQIESMMKAAESAKGDVYIINSENDAGKKLDGLGGIGALLRYKINY